MTTGEAKDDPIGKPAVASQPPKIDLGRIEMRDNIPGTFDIGAGRVYTITARIGFDAVNSYDHVLNDGNQKIVAPRQTALMGQPVKITAGQTEVTFTPDVWSKQ